MAKKKLIKGSWSKSEVKLLKKFFPRTNTQEVAKQLGRPLTAVRQKAYSMGLKTKGHSYWSNNDIKLLKELYPSRRTSEVADQLGRSLLAVMSKAQKMSLKKTKKYLKLLGRVYLRKT